MGKLLFQYSEFLQGYFDDDVNLLQLQLPESSMFFSSSSLKYVKKAWCQPSSLQSRL